MRSSNASGGALNAEGTRQIRSEGFRSERVRTEVFSLVESQRPAIAPRTGFFEGHESSFVATAVGGDHPEAEGFLGSANCPPELRRFLVAAAFGKNAREPC